ncbi:MAG: hypothetical protein IKH30_01635 [Clostridia bacterium]|nr:hypothetical protein [Clostridia bacterium]MBR4537224.1 hypothetical protein [Clostridia bacterium]MBR4537259.1 hypothetical protein [Clostridia bacterium]
MRKLNLQLFAEGEGQAMQSGGDVTGGEAGGQESQAQQLTPFQQMIQGEGKAEFEHAVGQRVQAAIQQRFKNNADYKRQLNSYAPIMQELSRRYGVDAGDAQGIYAKMTDDLSLYQKEADETGNSPETVRDMHRLRAEVERARAAEAQSAEDAALNRHIEQVAKQADELKKVFPTFDLMTEMANPAFVRMTSPGVGLSVKDAYYAIHGEEIAQEAMRYTAQQAGQRLAASVQAGASRPMENGQRRQGPVNMQVDIAHMSKADQERYAQRIKNGEIINFVDKF